MFMRISVWPVLGMMLIVSAASYLLGCFNGAVIVSKYILRDDVRNHGSGNAGLTNFCRTFGGPLTAVVILCDVLKAVIAVLLGSWLLGFIDPLFGKYWAGVFCLLGHMFPCMFHFKGGKGVATGLGVLLGISPMLGGFVLLTWLLVAFLTRYSSLSALVSAG